MRKLFYACIMTALAVGCAGPRKDKNTTFEEAESLIDAQLSEVMNNPSLTAEEIKAKSYSVWFNAYQEHMDDSIGYEAFLNMLILSDNPDEMIDMYDESSDLIHGSQVIQTKVDALYNLQTTQAGSQFVEIDGEDALTGETLSLSSLITEDKATLVDFWASWCGPCRREIKDHLLALAETGKVNIVSVAVWEESVDNTRKAMEDLGITWPVIFTGGRENSPTIKYGIVGIPTLVLIGTDGTIMARGHSVEDFADLIDHRNDGTHP
ncbi:MAG: TlpA family protein disulfide reductase [Bacteroidaceae bacterium]|nr:TlpA family protein disulfide reductase [Bacteroidaceae bacterium]